MSEIFRAFGLVFVIFSDDHDPPHVHVFHGREACKISLETLSVAAKPRCTLSKVTAQGFAACGGKPPFAAAGMGEDSWQRLTG